MLRRNLVGPSTLLMTLTGLLLVLTGELQLAPTHLSSLNLLGEFPPVFYLGLGLLCTAFVVHLSSGEMKTGAALFQIGSLFALLYVVPLVISGAPNAYHSYEFLSNSMYIMRSGHYNPTIPFQNYPGSWILYALFMMITNATNASVIVRLFPLIWQLLFGLAAFVATKALTGSSRISLVALWVFLTGNWLDQAYPSDESLGFFLFLILLVLLALKFRDSVRISVPFVALVLSISISHVLAALIALGTVLLLSLKIRGFRPLLGLFFVSYALWVIFGATSYVSSLGRAGFDLYSALASFFREGFIARVLPSTTTSMEHVIADRVELLIVGLFFIYAAAGLYVARRGRTRDLPFLKGYPFMIYVILAAVLTLVAVNSYAGNELFQRVFLFSLVPLSFYIGVLATRQSRKVLIAIFLFLVIAGSFNVFAQYNNTILYYVKGDQLQSSSFISRYTSAGVIYGDAAIGFASGGLTGNVQYDRYSIDTFWNLTKTTILAGSGTTYFSITPTLVGTYEYTLGMTPLQIQQLESHFIETNKLDLVYSNPDVTIYARPGQ